MNNIREIVKERGYQLGYVAKRISVHNSHLSMWISEDRYPSQDKLLKRGENNGKNEKCTNGLEC